MKEVSLQEIKTIAQNLVAQKKQWHFHLLTPDCLLNTSEKFVLVVENGTDNEIFTSTHDEKPMETSKSLLELLHGQQIFDDNKEELGEVSDTVKNMMIRAKQLNDNGFFWHHHVLFPYCTYNTHPAKWTIILEDPQTKEKIESVSDVEPKADMKEIEPAFYHQDIKK